MYSVNFSYRNLSPTYFLYKPNLETNLRQNESLVLGSKHVLVSLIMAPHDLKLHRVMSNTNTNRFKVVWDRSGQFLEKVHFCSFCSFRGPGTISGALHGCTTKFGPIYIMWNHCLAKLVQKQVEITLSRFCRNSVSCIQSVYNLYTKIRNHQLARLWM